MREIKKRRYLFAGALTMAIIFSGLAAGEFMDTMRLNYLQNSLEEERIDYKDLQTQYFYLSEVSPEDFCRISDQTIKKSLVRLKGLLDQLSDYQKSSDFSKEEYLDLKRDYTIANLRYWMLLRKSNELCDNDDIWVLYFHEEGCGSCPTQGFILTQIRKTYDKKVWVFPLDMEIEENMITILKERYNVTETPTLVVNDQVHHGFQNHEKVREIVAEELEKAGE
ncbi:MAG: thioredoxin family protein [Candidatus Aenigmatarchaeota archaeon]